MRSGFSIVELMVVVSIMGILAAFSVPIFRVGVETAKVDICAARLRSAWIAQRMYWLEHGTFASSLEELTTWKLLDGNLSEASDPYTYEVVAADESTFEVRAERTGDFWSGSITIDESGSFDGSVSDGSGNDVAPPANG